MQGDLDPALDDVDEADFEHQIAHEVVVGDGKGTADFIARGAEEFCLLVEDVVGRAGLLVRPAVELAVGVHALCQRGGHDSRLPVSASSSSTSSRARRAACRSADPEAWPTAGVFSAGAEAGVGSVAIATLQLMGHAGETVLRLEKVGAGNSRGKSGFLIAASLRCCRRIGNGM